MKFDTTRLIGAVAREVTSREYEGWPARVLVATRTYDTSPEDLWDALTNGERIPRWVLPISGDLRLGGHYQLEGNAGGEITGCEPPRNLALTWGMQGDTSWVNVHLSKDPDGGTRLQLEHIAHVPDDLWDQFGPGAVGVGWEGAMMGLDRYLSTGVAVDSKEAMAWLLSEEGKKFTGGISDAWGDASIAAGTDPASARAAARRTTAAYTGETEGTTES